MQLHYTERVTTQTLTRQKCTTVESSRACSLWKHSLTLLNHKFCSCIFGFIVAKKKKGKGKKPTSKLFANWVTFILGARCLNVKKSKHWHASLWLLTVSRLQVDLRPKITQKNTLNLFSEYLNIKNIHIFTHFISGKCVLLKKKKILGIKST